MSDQVNTAGPHFLGIGVQKAGTTWLMRNLMHHDEIWLPFRKELHYFDRDPKYPSTSYLQQQSILKRIFGSGPASQSWRYELSRCIKNYRHKPARQHLLWDLRYFFGDYNNQWYQSLFREGRGKICGEITPAYAILDAEDIARIHAWLPELKVILLLRNPVERAWSMLRHEHQLGHINLNSMSLSDIEARLNLPYAIERGDYSGIIKRWTGAFPSQQVHIDVYERIERDPEDLIKDILKFLGAKNLQVPAKWRASKIFNQSARIEMPEGVRQCLIQKYKKDALLIEEGINRNYSLREFWPDLFNE